MSSGGFAAPVRLAGHGVVLREWTDGDLPVMSGLFDDPDVERFTPLRSPFDLAAARAYLDGARQGRAEGRRVQLAITTDGGRALGEVVMFHADEGGEDAELGYTVGARYRRRGLASRAVRLATEYAYGVLGARRVLLRIVAGNTASAGVARAAGFHLTAEAPLMRAGASEGLFTWEHSAVG